MNQRTRVERIERARADRALAEALARCRPGDAHGPPKLRLFFELFTTRPAWAAQIRAWLGRWMRDLGPHATQTQLGEHVAGDAAGREALREFFHECRARGLTDLREDEIEALREPENIP